MRSVEAGRDVLIGLAGTEEGLPWSVRRRLILNCGELLRLVCWLLGLSVVWTEAWRRLAEMAEHPGVLTGRTNCSSCLGHDVRQMMSLHLTQRKVFERMQLARLESVECWHAKTKTRC